MRSFVSTTVSALMLASFSAYANQGEFCSGFAEGYRSVRGEAMKLPTCPVVPAIPEASTPFREGLKQGIRAARAAVPRGLS